MNSSSLRALHPIKFKLLYIFFLCLLRWGFLLQTCSKPPIWNFRKWQPRSAWAPQTCPNQTLGQQASRRDFLCQFILFLLPLPTVSWLYYIGYYFKNKQKKRGIPIRKKNSIRILAPVPCWVNTCWGRIGRVEYSTSPLLPSQIPHCSFSKGCRRQCGARVQWQPSVPATAPGNTYAPLRLLSKHEFSNTDSSLRETLIFYLSYQVHPFKLLSKTFFIIFSLSSQELMVSEFLG